MIQWLLGKIVGSFLGAIFGPLLSRFFPSTDFRLGKAEQQLAQQKETDDVKAKMDAVKPVNPDSVDDRLQDGSF